MPTTEQFAADVRDGLKLDPQHLHSKYFYDATGDRLFQQIMELPEYYLTKSEFQIFQSCKDDILEQISPDMENFHLIEFGAGDGKKTTILLEYFLSQVNTFTYSPVDISEHAIDGLAATLSKELPDLVVAPCRGDYFECLKTLSKDSEVRNVVLFLGSNIGNFTHSDALAFLDAIRESIHKDDKLLIGFDLKKDPSIILSAYNDPGGITARFNLNILTRINNELKGNFDIGKWSHYPVYNPQEGVCKSYLVAKEDQEVEIKELDETYPFSKWAAIHTEISQKYDLRMIEELADASGFDVQKLYYDEHHYYVDALFTAI